MKIYRKLVVAIGAITVIAAAGATVALAYPGTLITTTVRGHRATLSDSVQVNQDRVKFQTKDPTDVLVQTITFQPQGTSGWHFRPGIVIVVATYLLPDGAQLTTNL